MHSTTLLIADTEVHSGVIQHLQTTLLPCYIEFSRGNTVFTARGLGLDPQEELVIGTRSSKL